MAQTQRPRSCSDHKRPHTWLVTRRLRPAALCIEALGVSPKTVKIRFQSWRPRRVGWSVDTVTASKPVGPYRELYHSQNRKLPKSDPFRWCCGWVSWVVASDLNAQHCCLSFWVWEEAAGVRRIHSKGLPELVLLPGGPRPRRRIWLCVPPPCDCGLGDPPRCR